MKHEDKVEIIRSEHVSEYDGKTYIEAKFIIKELYGYGAVIFTKTPLEVHVSIEKGADIAHFWYDFGMSDEVCVTKDKNFLYNYGNTNEECDPIQTVLNTIKFDLMHAFNHYNGDPNYGKTHWALYGNLKDRVLAYDWWEEDEGAVEAEKLRRVKNSS
jgi:hypothetical protein